MSTLNIEFIDDNMCFKSKVEDDLEQAVSEALNNKIAENVPNDVFSHISDLRHNILKWYPFKKECSILEIGAGMGAITGLFCSVAKKVVAVEKKQSRAEIIKTRFISCTHLTVINDNIFNVELDFKFDYVIIGDTFVYAKKYLKAENAQQTLIEKAKEFLKEDGTILLATENKLGLKYFSGAVENYSHRFFSGLNDFNDYNIIRTFTKSEILNISKACGLKHIKFYYPYPDNIFTLEIYTDDCINTREFGAALPDKDLETERFHFFNEQRMFSILQKENVVTTFANSFLVEMSCTNNHADVSYIDLVQDAKKLNSRYLPQYLPSFIYPVDVISQGDLISDAFTKTYKSKTLECALKENELIGIIKQYDETTTAVDKNVETFIDKRMNEIEKQYGVEVLFWFARGSVTSGIFRDNSDLDLAFVYKCSGKEKVAAIHDIIGYGLDFWGWEIGDALKTLKNSHFEYQSEEHRRAGLDYYYGLYCAFGNYFAKGYNLFFDKTKDVFMSAFSPKICSELFLYKAQEIYEKLLKNKTLSYADYLNCTEYILCTIHILKGGLPGDVHIRKLARSFLPGDIKNTLKDILKKYKTSLRKNSQIMSIEVLNRYFCEALPKLKESIRDYDNSTNADLNNALLLLNKIIYN